MIKLMHKNETFCFLFNTAKALDQFFFILELNGWEENTNLSSLHIKEHTFSMLRFYIRRVIPPFISTHSIATLEWRFPRISCTMCQFGALHTTAFLTKCSSDTQTKLLFILNDVCDVRIFMRSEIKFSSKAFINWIFFDNFSTKIYI